ncbi:hypothetical protein AB0A77_02080 [Streptomyces varsoviensis]|uniref:hypothetical protein n=1 Tax=Streptomyces varsoviensis TaxID=67373 RepID=UPI0033D454B1
MSPDVLVAVVAGVATVAAAAVAAIPALLATLRRHAGVVEDALTAEGSATRDRVAELRAHLDARVTEIRDDTRADIADVREQILHVREWQAGHDAEHLLIGLRRDDET